MIYKLILISIVLGLLLLFISEKFIDKVDIFIPGISLFLVFGLPIILYLVDEIVIPLFEHTKKEGIASTLLIISMPFGFAMIPLFFLSMSIQDNDDMAESIIFLLKVAFRGFMLFACLSLIAHELF